MSLILTDIIRILLMKKRRSKLQISFTFKSKSHLGSGVILNHIKVTENSTSKVEILIRTSLFSWRFAYFSKLSSKSSYLFFKVFIPFLQILKKLFSNLTKYFVKIETRPKSGDGLEGKNIGKIVHKAIFLILFDHEASLTRS